MRKLSLVFLLGLFFVLSGCNGTEPEVEWHSQIFTALGDEFYYEGTVHNGGRGTATEVEVTFLFPEDLVQRKRSEMNPIELGEIGPEEISTFNGRMLFDFSNLSKQEILNMLDDLEIKIRWKEDGTVNEDYLRQKQDIENKQAG